MREKQSLLTVMKQNISILWRDFGNFVLLQEILCLSYDAAFTEQLWLNKVQKRLLQGYSVTSALFLKG